MRSRLGDCSPHRASFASRHFRRAEAWNWFGSATGARLWVAQPSEAKS
jgi:hypothetical protein